MFCLFVENGPNVIEEECFFLFFWLASISGQIGKRKIQFVRNVFVLLALPIDGIYVSRTGNGG